MSNKLLLLINSIILIVFIIISFFFLSNNVFFLWTCSIFSKPETASSLLSRAIEIDPMYLQAYLDRGWLYYKSANIEKAFNDFKKALELNNKDASVLYALALVKKEQNNFEAFEKDLNIIIKLFPIYPWSYITRSNILKKKGNIVASLIDLMIIEEIKGNYEASLILANRIIEKDSCNHRVFLKRAEINVALKHYDNAFKDFDKAINLNSKSQWYFFKRGDFRFKMGDHDGAFLDFKNALNLDNNFSEAYEKAAEICLMQKNYELYKLYMHEAVRSHKFYGRNNLAEKCILAMKMKVS